jgi:hypothetical protein
MVGKSGWKVRWVREVNLNLQFRLQKNDQNRLIIIVCFLFFMAEECKFVLDLSITDENIQFPPDKTDR